MQALLAQSAERGAQNDPIRVYAERLLAGFPEALNNKPFALRSTVERSNALIEPLSERELEVLQLIANGASNQVIADVLVISIGTVKSHINHILGKLAACNRTEAVARARQLGLLAL